MPWEEIYFHHGAVCEVRNSFDAGHVRNHRASPDVDEDAIRRKFLIAHAHFVGRFEPRMALIYRAVGHILKPRLDAGVGFAGDLILTRLYALHVHAGTASGETKFRSASRQMCGIGARDHGLGRDATGVYTGS